MIISDDYLTLASRLHYACPVRAINQASAARHRVREGESPSPKSEPLLSTLLACRSANVVRPAHNLLGTDAEGGHELPPLFGQPPELTKMRQRQDAI